MPRRLTILTAGNYTEVSVCPILIGCETSHERAVIRKCCTDAKQSMNDKSSVRRFRFLMASNFSPGDYVATLTYSESTLPATPDLAKKRFLRKFIRRLRKEFQKCELQPLRYMHVTEGLHGDHRIHHHIILPGVPGLFDMVRRSWDENGAVAFDRIGHDAYESWASYLTKEPRDKGRRRLGERMWIPSLNLKKPIIETYDVENDYVFVPPFDAQVRLNQTVRYEMGWYQYVSYMIPQAGCGVSMKQ